MSLTVSGDGAKDPAAFDPSPVSTQSPHRARSLVTQSAVRPVVVAVERGAAPFCVASELLQAKTGSPKVEGLSRWQVVNVGDDVSNALLDLASRNFESEVAVPPAGQSAPRPGGVLPKNREPGDVDFEAVARSTPGSQSGGRTERHDPIRSYRPLVADDVCGEARARSATGVQFVEHGVVAVPEGILPSLNQAIGRSLVRGVARLHRFCF